MPTTLRYLLLFPFACGLVLSVCTVQACDKHIPSASGMASSGASLSSR